MNFAKYSRISSSRKFDIENVIRIYATLQRRSKNTRETGLRWNTLAAIET